MTMLNGKAYCNVTPCQLEGELPKQTNGDRIRGMSDAELSEFLRGFNICLRCNNIVENKCTYETCDEVGRKCLLEWLKQPVEN